MSAAAIQATVFTLLARISRQRVRYQAPAINPWTDRSSLQQLRWSGTAVSWRRASRKTANA